MKTISIFLFSTVCIPIMLRAQSTGWFQKGLDTEDPMKQIEYFTRSIELGIELSPAYFCRASARLAQGDVRGAVDDYTKCIEIDPNDGMAYYNRGMAKKHISDDYQGAVADINTSCEIQIVEYTVNNPVNGVDLQSENYPCAIGCYNKVLERYPDNASAYGYLGYCYLGMQDYSLALENFNKAVSLQPGKTDAYLGLSLVFYYQNDRVNAKKNLDQARRLKPMLQQGIVGFETFKKEGFICNDKDDTALKMMLSDWN